MKRLRFLQRLLKQLQHTKNEIYKTGLRFWSVFLSIGLGAKHHAWQLRVLLPLFACAAAGFYFFPGSHTPGHIVYSDMDFGFQREYLFRIFPLWNDQWSTANFFNLTRIAILIPASIVAWVLGFSASVWEKSIIYLLLFLSNLSMYTLLINLFREDRKLGRLHCHSLFLFFGAFLGGLFYAYNPYAVIRIQHLYLLVGYSLLPFIFLFAVRLTEDFTHISKTTKTYELKNQRLGLWAQKLKKIRKEHLQNTTSQDKIICSLISFALLWAMAVGAVHYLFFAFFLVAFWGIYRLS